MDIGSIIGLFILLYVIPELWRRLRPKQYEYPQVPDVPVPPEPSTQQETSTAPMFHNISQQDPTNVPVSQPLPPPVSVPSTAPMLSAWQGQLDQALVINGLIFAEILQPPRSRRTLGYTTKIKSRRNEPMAE